MLKAFFLLGLLSLPCISFAQIVVRNVDYNEISRRTGGSKFTQSFANSNPVVLVDAIRIEATQGRVQLLNVEFETTSGAISYEQLLEMDPENRSAAEDYRGFLAREGNEPQSLELYLDGTYQVTKVSVTIESFQAQSKARVSMIVKDQGSPSPNPTPIPGPTNPIPPPPPAPLPSCDRGDLESQINRCTRDVSEIEFSIESIGRDIQQYRGLLQSRDAELAQCLDTNADWSARIQELEREYSVIPRQVQANRQATREFRRATNRILNPVQTWSCFLVVNSGEQTFEATGSNRAQLLQDLLRRCQNYSASDKDCGNERWNPTENNRWGCNPVGGYKDLQVEGE